MSKYLLLTVILIPVVMSVFVYRLKSEKAIRIVTFGTVMVTSILMWALMFKGVEGSYDVLRFTNKLVLSLNLDGLGKFFAGIVSLLWPLTLCL